ncbi:MAG: 2Fe-2S iron-sulfur cluster binding domain-containing protein [Chitinophagaceae bacterium]|nr:2Fe-2S iron-sulfur cluster binding domain-containing protein [Chitinophagaceae bacterium]
MERSYTVKFTKSNIDALWNASEQSLLDLAEANGLNPDFNCRMGTCSTCETILLKGQVLHDPEPFIEIEKDKILLCCAKPVSDIEIEL